jgi:hypothetical protein
MTERAERAHDEQVQQLYQLPPEGFVAARDALVKTMREGGDREGAEAVKRLKRPSVTAWAIDRLSGDAPKELQKLFEANERLASAMGASGRDAGKRFRTAAEERQRIVSRLADRAGAALEDAGLSASRANLDRIAATLMATATDHHGADQVRAGILDRDLSAAGGFGDAFGGAPQEAHPAGRATKVDAAADRRRERAERDAEERAKEATAIERAAGDADAAAAMAEREAQRATKVAETRRKDADRARRDAERARARARSAAEHLADLPER